MENLTLLAIFRIKSKLAVHLYFMLPRESSLETWRSNFWDTSVETYRATATRKQEPLHKFLKIKERKRKK